MALAEKLELLRTTKQEIRTAIEEKGQNVGEIPFSQYPEKITSISGGGQLAPFIDGSLTSLDIPDKAAVIRENACRSFGALTSVTFLGTPDAVDTTAFSACSALADIYVPWPDGAVEGTPWGAANAAIHYDWK